MSEKKLLTLIYITLASIVVLMIAWFIFSMNYPTEKMCNGMKYMSSDEINEYSFTDSKIQSCFYPACSKESQWHLKSDSFYPDLYGMGIEMLNSMPNKARFAMVADSFSYTEQYDHTYYDTNNYLVLDNSGRLRIETETDKYVITVDGETKTTDFVLFEGYYCNDHHSLAKEIWQNEVEKSFAFTNYLLENGIWISIVIPLAIFGIGITCYYTIQHIRKKKAAQTA